MSAIKSSFSMLSVSIPVSWPRVHERFRRKFFGDRVRETSENEKLWNFLRFRKVRFRKVRFQRRIQMKR